MSTSAIYLVRISTGKRELNTLNRIIFLLVNYFCVQQKCYQSCQKSIFKNDPKAISFINSSRFYFLICFYFNTIILNFLNIFYKTTSLSHKPCLITQIIKTATQNLKPENIYFFIYKRIRREVDTLSPVCEQGVKRLEQKNFKTKCFYRSFLIWNLSSKFGVNKLYMKISMGDRVS